jgi:C_GCAxxG_C_C family probable redox protein
MSLKEVAKKIELAAYDTPEAKPSSKEKLLDRIAWDAYYNDRVYQGCTRCVLNALQTHLHLGTGEVLKASTAFSGGVARMGETCGALIGGIMAIGLVLGSDKLEDMTAYRETIEASYKMYNKFKKEMGSTICFEIQNRLFGRSFDFKKNAEAKKWRKAGGLEKCPMVCAIAARIAADIILRS